MSQIYITPLSYWLFCGFKAQDVMDDCLSVIIFYNNQLGWVSQMSKMWRSSLRLSQTLSSGYR